MIHYCLRFLFLIIFFLNYLVAFNVDAQKSSSQPSYKDTSFLQDYSIKYFAKDADNLSLRKICCDRNGNIQIYSSKGILKKSGGQFLYPGELVSDISYLPMLNKKIKSIGLYQNQFVYVDDKAVFSNAWAGTLYCNHTTAAVTTFCGGEDFSFLLSDGSSLQYLKDSKLLWEGNTDNKLIDILYDSKRNFFWLLCENGVSVFDPKQKLIQKKFSAEGLSCFSLSNKNDELVIGTHNGYFKFIINTAQQTEVINKLPCVDITVTKEINNRLWFGSTSGAFTLQRNGKYKYYASKRWLPSDKVTDIADGANGTVLILTEKGLGEIRF